MEVNLVADFITETGASESDAISCLQTWGWDLKKALIDYNDTSTSDYLKGKSRESSGHSAKEVHRRSSSSKKHQRPPLTKLDSFEVSEYKKLSRGISRAEENVNLVSRARKEIDMDFHTTMQGKNLENLYFIETPDSTFTLPDLSLYTEDFRTFLEKDLIECATLNSLEQAKRLNWWVDTRTCRKLWPLATTGDGNCLLHAASLAMWGFHDRRLTLRKALHSILSHGDYRDVLWRRWRFQQTRLNKEAGFVFSEAEWAKEWEEIVAIASPEPRNLSNSSASAPKSAGSRRRSMILDRTASLTSELSIDNNATYESLEEIHVLALAHVLRRTIIVVADVVLRDINGEALAPIPFGGIYLPFEVPPAECHRGPLLLTYDMAHFSALVAMNNGNDPLPSLIPLTDSKNVLLPIQFCIDPGKDFNWRDYDGDEGNWALTDREHVALLKEFLDIIFGGNVSSPMGDEELYEDYYSDEELEKKLSEGEIVLSDENLNQNSLEILSATNGQPNKSKAAKQLQTVAKQFGSIGKSMGKKFKKNIGSITRIGSKSHMGSANNKKPSISSTTSSSSSGSGRCMILCAQLKVKQHEYQEEMIQNYLECAQERFIECEKAREKREIERHLDVVLKTAATKREDSDHDRIYDVPVNCINNGCCNYGTSLTSYLCHECYEKQREREQNRQADAYELEMAPRYGTGNSKFYTQTDLESHSRINRIPSVRRLNELDQTLYLSKSTFYNDQKIGANDNLLNYDKPHRSAVVNTTKSTTASGALSDYRAKANSSDSCTALNQTNSSPITNPSNVASVYSPGNLLYSQHVSLPPQSPPSNLPKKSAPARSVVPQSSFPGYSHPQNAPSLQPINDAVSNYIYDSAPTSATYRIKQHSADRMIPVQHFYTNNSYHNNSSDISNQERCRTRGCMFYGNAGTNYYCSKCCQEYQQQSRPKILTDV